MLCFYFVIILLFEHVELAGTSYKTPHDLWLIYDFSRPTVLCEQELSQKYGPNFKKPSNKSGIKMPFQSSLRANYFSKENFDFYIGFNKPIKARTGHANQVQKESLAQLQLPRGPWGRPLTHHFAFGATVTF